MRIEHTSSSEHGQVYLPEVNWALMILTISLVLAFGTSSALVGAYGIAVTTEMAITTILLAVVARTQWGWGLARTTLVVGLLLSIDLAFLAANIPKIPQGGWFPLLVALLCFVLMTTWRRGRKELAARLRASQVPLEEFLGRMRAHPPLRVPGTAFFLTGNPTIVPVALERNVAHNKVLHQQVFFLTLDTLEVPYFDGKDRIDVQELGEGLYRVAAHFGFMETPNVPYVISRLRRRGFDLVDDDISFFLGRERVIATKEIGRMAYWREKLFEFMARNSQRATAFFRIPHERVIEVGTQVRI